MFLDTVCIMMSSILNRFFIIIVCTDTHQSGEFLGGSLTTNNPILGEQSAHLMVFVVLTQHWFEYYIICGCTSYFGNSSNRTKD